MKLLELNMDGLVGPTHHYGGLSQGNLASMKHQKQISNPKKAALEGLEKMKFLLALGLKQGFFIPHERPFVQGLRETFFSKKIFPGSTTSIIQQAWKEDPETARLFYSASAMWTANAATVTPSPDSKHGRPQLTPANLLTQPHRRLEAPFTTKMMRVMFPADTFDVHDPGPYPDEGAANHTRLYDQNGRGCHVFVSGPSVDNARPAFVSRQDERAFLQIEKQHGVIRSLHLHQQQTAIDAGAFHNDVVATGNGSVYLCHETSYVESNLESLLRHHLDDGLRLFMVKEQELPLSEAIQSYLFNSQLITLPDNTVLLLAPMESQENVFASRVIETWLDQKVIDRVEHMDLRQSMKNGGGPACLRLRVPLTAEELSSVNRSFVLSDNTHEQLVTWVKKHYRDRLDVDDLRDPKFADECFMALDELTQWLSLGSVYTFQM